ncbi:GNAT family N-acetyltransferase [Thalassotalea sp. Y01]|uniref:GNAT family N-acetyltransferase n=1 Tax=Thalassotalea sp. Y01 TaxID=2729613 RepID=UPI00145DDC10|nr:GNAT family N-acetyltransferase [Thalassotalea sp. Y01]NMP17777.1 GNAT family N-acetyltransferase [Thalassotalea sp. Y01]
MAKCSNTTFKLEFVDSLSKVDKQQWQALFADNPFCHCEFLLSLEQHCLGQGSGWYPQHILVFDGSDIVAAMPGYIKTHSYGEYMFDWNWADAYQQTGQDYYPKYVSAIPFTPVSSRRIAIAASHQQHSEQIISAVIKGCQYLQDKLQLSNSQWLYIDKPTSDILATTCPQRIDLHYLWHNRNYQDFDDFLAQLTSRKRKNIKKERAKIAQQHFTFQWLYGAQINDDLWQQFYRFYVNTYRYHSGHDGYLNLPFFQSLSTVLRQHVRLLMVADQTGEFVAGALFVVSDDTLYGRYWGGEAGDDFLHFEVCYYQGIEYAIKHQLAFFDAGVQGEHKLIRGFEPKLSYGNYLFTQQPFAAAITEHLSQQNRHIQMALERAKQYLPYRKDG